MTLEEKMDLVIARLDDIEKKLANTYTESQKQTMMTQDDHCSYNTKLEDYNDGYYPYS